MLVKTLAMRRLKGEKRTFYMDEHGGYSHKDVDFYPAELVEKIIEDLSNQVLEERKKWTSVFDSSRSKRDHLRKQRHGAVAALHRLQMAYAYSQYVYYAMEVELCKISVMLCMKKLLRNIDKSGGDLAYCRNRIIAIRTDYGRRERTYDKEPAPEYGRHVQGGEYADGT